MKKRYVLNKDKFLDKSELARLKNLIEPANRDTLLIGMALKTGARANEVLNIKKSDLDLEKRTVYIRGLKNSDDREIPLKKDFFEKIVTYANSTQNEKLFNISYQYLNLIWDKYRPVKKKFHSLRHTFAMELYRSTKDILLVKSALGHRNLLNTMIYCDYINKNERLKDVLKIK